MKILPVGMELFQDILAVVITIVLIQLFIMLNDYMKRHQMVSQYITRKFIHIWAAPIYIICWALYSQQWFSPYLACIVPGLFAMQFILIGTGKMKNEAFVQSMCRSGDPKELLKGTLYYAIFMIIGTVFFWTSFPASELPASSPVAIVIFMTLAFGDGFADIVGRSVNRMKFTIFSQKSVPGTLAMFIVSLFTTFLLLMLFGYSLDQLLVLVTLAVLFATLVEISSPKEMDNLTIPIAIILVFVIIGPILIPTPTWQVYHLYLP